jgi:mannose-6-phosphate isomerase-like protein (cupin superfamily)
MCPKTFVTVVIGLLAVTPAAYSQSAQGAPGSAQGTTAAPKATPAPAKPPARTRAAAAPKGPTRSGLDLEVTDISGSPLGDVRVRIAGQFDREAATDARGEIHFQNLNAGTYRLRFDHEDFITFEREVTLPLASSAPLVVVLTAAPPVAVVAPPAPPARQELPRPIGEPAIVYVPEFWEKNHIKRGEPQKLSAVGCNGYATTRILQMREPMPDRVNADADETLYVVAGEATLRLNGTDRRLASGTLSVIPRGTTYSIARTGKAPEVVLVSVLSGPPCASLSSQ